MIGQKKWEMVDNRTGEKNKEERRQDGRRQTTAEQNIENRRQGEGRGHDRRQTTGQEKREHRRQDKIKEEMTQTTG